MEILKLQHMQWQSAVRDLLAVAERPGRVTSFEEVSEDEVRSPYKVFTPIEQEATVGHQEKQFAHIFGKMHNAIKLFINY